MSKPENALVEKVERKLWDQGKTILNSWTLRLSLAALLIGAYLWIRNGVSFNDTPALLRAGAGCAGGFLVGFIFRRLIKAAALVAALVLGGVALLKGTGLIHLDFAAIELHIRDSLAWTTGKLESFQTFITGYLPSGGATGWGVFRGVRTRTQRQN